MIDRNGQDTPEQKPHHDQVEVLLLPFAMEVYLDPPMAPAKGKGDKRPELQNAELRVTEAGNGTRGD